MKKEHDFYFAIRLKVANYSAFSDRAIPVV